MRYVHVCPGIFRARPNRFIAIVELEGREEVCHVKNTGRCRELLLPGATVYLARSGNPARKTRYDLIAVEKGPLLINMDSAAPNAVFREWVMGGFFLPHTTALRGEYTWEDSRFDFYLESQGRPVLAEIKGVTLEENGLALFPDAPTQRGVKHLKGLIRAASQGFDAWACFVVQMQGMSAFVPNRRTHPAFAQALEEAAAAGVHLLALECAVTPDSLAITGRRLTVLL